MSNNIIEIAAQAMHVTIEDAQKHYKIIDGINAFYFWNPVRGGLAIIVSEETGGISVAYKGQFHLRLTAEELERILTKEE